MRVWACTTTTHTLHTEKWMAAGFSGAILHVRQRRHRIREGATQTVHVHVHLPVSSGVGMAHRVVGQGACPFACTSQKSVLVARGQPEGLEAEQGLHVLTHSPRKRTGGWEPAEGTAPIWSFGSCRTACTSQQGWQWVVCEGKLEGLLSGVTRKVPGWTTSPNQRT